MSGVSVRPAVESDAARIAELANRLSVSEGLPPDVYTERTILRDGFGADPAFRVLVAEIGAELVGYASYHATYDSDVASRDLWLVDLYVSESARRQGVGRRLMAAMARTALETGARTLWWGVRAKNVRAQQFYARLGARNEEAKIMGLSGDAMRSLAESMS